MKPSVYVLAALLFAPRLLAVEAGDAQPSEALALTPPLAAELARANNENVLADRAALVAVERETRAAQSFLYPQLDAAAGYARRTDQPTTDPLGVTTFEDQDDWQTSVRLEQLIWANDIHGSSRDLRRENIRESRALLAQTSRDVAQFARDAMANWALAQATVEIAEERLQQREDEFKRTSDLADPRVGIATRLDVGQAEINLIDIRDQLLGARSAQNRRKHDVARIIARKPDSFRVDYRLIETQDIDGLLLAAQQAILLGPEVEALQAAEAGLQARYRQVGSDNLPTLSGFGEFAAGGEEYDDLHDTWAAGLTLRWQLSDGGDRYHTRHALVSRQREIKQQRESVVRERQTRIDQLAIRVDTLRERIPELERAVTIARTNYQDALANYGRGLIDLTRLGDFSLAVGESRFRLASLIHEQILVANQLRALAE